MPVAFALACLLALAGCAYIHPYEGTGAADLTAAGGFGEGPTGEVPTGGAFGPWTLGH